MKHLPEVFADRVHEEHIRREDAPSGLLEPRPYRGRPRPKTALIAEACRRKYEERVEAERLVRITDMKYCSRGKHHVMRSQFTKLIYAKDGLQPWCKECVRQYRLEYKNKKSAEYAQRNSWQRA